MTDADYSDIRALRKYTYSTASPGTNSRTIYLLCEPHPTQKKRKFMCFKEDGSISTLSGKRPNLVEQFTYLGSNISSTESNVKIRLTKAWNCQIIDHMEV